MTWELPRAADILDAAYRVDLPGDQWLRTIFDAASQSFPDLRARVAAEVELSADDEYVVNGICADSPEIARVAASRLVEGGSAFARRTALSGKPTFTFSETLDPRWERRFLERLSLADYRIVNGVSGDRAGVILGAGAEPTTLPEGVAWAWSGVAAHLAAAGRLRRRLAEEDAALECVLTPAGRVVHAEGSARPPTHQEALSRAARAIDRARTRARRDDESAVLDAWQGLVSGRWSVVDQFESDGRRYVVARVNEPWLREKPRRTRLSHREQQIAELASRGHQSKFIAYELGLTASTVAWHLGRIAKKLGVNSRVELIRALAAESLLPTVVPAPKARTESAVARKRARVPK